MNPIYSLSLKRIQVIGFLLLLGCSLPIFAQRKISPELKALVTENSRPGLLFFRTIPELRPNNIFTTYKSAFGLGKNDKMVNYRAETNKLGITTYRYQQYYQNYPIEYRTVIVDMKDGKLKSMIGECIQGINIRAVPRLSENAALQFALKEINAEKYFWQDPGNEAFIKQRFNDPQATYFPKGELVIINEDIHKNTGDFHLCYKFLISATQPYQELVVYVDATSGKVIHKNDALVTHWPNQLATARTVYSGDKTVSTQLIHEGDGAPYYFSKDSTINRIIYTFNMDHYNGFGYAYWFTDTDTIWETVNANLDQYGMDLHWGMAMAYDYFLTRHGRNSWDNNGLRLTAGLHWGVKYFNAAFNSNDKVLKFGDADGSKINPLVSIDVIGHEYTHAIQNFAIDFVYSGESGALSEAFSDMFATDLEYSIPGKSANYLIGEETYADPTKYLRSLKDPKTSEPPQPDTYEGMNWINPANLIKDRGGVHYNCGIMNKWFYLLSEGGKGTNDKGNKYNVKGIGRDKAIMIAYNTMTLKVVPTSDFEGARAGSFQAAKELFPGDCSPEVIACENAWYAVGVGDSLLQIDSVHVTPTSCVEDNGKCFVHVIALTIPGYASYLWSNGATTPEITGLASGNYNVTITDLATGCEVDTSLTVKQDVMFYSNISKQDISYCGAHDGSAWLTLNFINGTPEIHWSNGATTQSISNLAKGLYWASIRDTSNNCTKTESIIIREPSPIVSISGGGPRSYCKGKPRPSTTLTARVSDCQNCTYQWSNGATSSSISVTETGTFSVVVANAAGCSASASANVTYWEKDCDNPGNKWEIPVVRPSDPNDIVGPVGYGSPRYVAASANGLYTVHFENSPEFATAPALKVLVDVPFDTQADMFSLRLGEFGFGNFNFSPPVNVSSYYTRLDLQDSLGLFLDVTAGIDLDNHKAFWILQSIDPETGVEPTDPSMGFLPVNDSITHKGEGYVCFTQRALNTAVTGDTIAARASIVFDINSAIMTNTWANVVDAVPPSSHVLALPANTDTTSFDIVIEGSDDTGGSGLKQFSLYVAAGNEMFYKYGDITPDSVVNFTGLPGVTYKFFSLATDNVGNVEPMKSSPEALISINDLHAVISGTLSYDNLNATPLKNVKLNLKNTMGIISDSTLTDISGKYKLQPPQTGKYVIESSSSQPWGGVNAMDALMILRDFTGLELLTPLRKKAADVDLSGAANSVDALLVARRFVNLINEFEAGDWYFEQDSLDFTASNLTKDFKGICMGDVNGSFNPGIMKGEPAVALFTEGRLTMNQGEIISLPLRIKEDLKLGAISLILQYPKDLIDVVDVVAGGDAHGNLVYSSENGELRIAWYDTKPMLVDEGNRAVLFLKIKARNIGATMFVSFGISEGSCLAEAESQFISQSKLFIPVLCIDVPSQYQLFSNSPNPFSSQTTLSYALPEAAMVKVSVLNALGEQLEVLQNEYKTEGTYQLLFDGSKLSNGIYYGKFEAEGLTGNFVQAVKMVLIRK